MGTFHFTYIFNCSFDAYLLLLMFLMLLAHLSCNFVHSWIRHIAEAMFSYTILIFYISSFILTNITQKNSISCIQNFSKQSSLTVFSYIIALYINLYYIVVLVKQTTEVKTLRFTTSHNFKTVGQPYLGQSVAGFSPQRPVFGHRTFHLAFAIQNTGTCA